MYSMCYMYMYLYNDTIPNSVMIGMLEPIVDPLLSASNTSMGLPMGENPGGKNPVKKTITQITGL